MPPEHEDKSCEGNPAKRQTTGDAKSSKMMLKDLPANQFLKQIDQFRGPEVQVFAGVQKKLFVLPKNLLCYNSTYFDVAFNGHFEEGATQELHLESASPETFTLITQWLYTGNIVIPEDDIFDDDDDATATATISQSVQFLHLADYLEVLGPFNSVLRTMEDILMRNRNALKSEHIHEAAKLPSGHPARNLFARACLRPYMNHLRGKAHDEWRLDFEKEIHEVDEFALDLFKVFHLTAKTSTEGKRGQRMVRDPLSGMLFVAPFF